MDRSENAVARQGTGAVEGCLRSETRGGTVQRHPAPSSKSRSVRNVRADGSPGTREEKTLHMLHRVVFRSRSWPHETSSYDDEKVHAGRRHFAFWTRRCAQGARSEGFHRLVRRDRDERRVIKGKQNRFNNVFYGSKSTSQACESLCTVVSAVRKILLSMCQATVVAPWCPVLLCEARRVHIGVSPR